MLKQAEMASEQISVCPTSPSTVCQAESTLQETINASNEDDSQSSIDLQIYITSSYCSYFTMLSLWDAISGGLHLLCRALGCQGQISRAGCNLNSGRVQINAVKEKRKLQCLPGILFQQRARETERKFVLATQACLCLFSFPLLSPNPQALLDVSF